LSDRTLIATMGFDERHVLPALRLMPYDRLVVVAGRGTFRSPGFRRLKALEPDLRAVGVKPFDLGASLASIRETIGLASRDGPVRISASGGPKTLTNAAILAAFQEGIEAWYCDPDPVRLPVLRGMRLEEAFSPAERVVADLVRRPVPYDRLVTTASARGLARRTAHAAVRSLAAKGLIDMLTEQGAVAVRPSSRFPLFRDHLRPAAKKG